MRFHEFKTELNEVSMAPGRLSKLASSINAQCGIEFEMYVPSNIVGGGGDSNLEREICYLIDDIFEYLDNNDYSYPEDKPSNMKEEYYEYYDNRMDEEWDSEKEDAVKEIIEDEFDYDSFYESQFEDMDLDDEEMEAALEAVNNKDESNKHYSEAHDNLEEAIQDEVDMAIRRQSREYEEARDSWYNSRIYTPDQEDYLRSIGIRTMADALYYLDIEEKSANIDTYELAEKFEMDSGYSAEGAESYHGNQSSKGKVYVVELDSSLDDDAPDEYNGVEIVSPTLPLDEIQEHLNFMFKWCDQHNCVTNDATGLHMNVSLTDVDMSQLDYIKLVLFLGDNHILKQFNRQSSTYCQSALNQIKQYTQKNVVKSFEMLNTLKASLSTLAKNEILKTNSPGKYTSANPNHLSDINPDDRRIEFRSPGGDWLHIDKQELLNTINRFVVAMDIACDPSKHAEEYAKKLYKLINPNNLDNVEPIRNYVLNVAGLSSGVSQDSFSYKNKKKEQSPARASQWSVSYMTQPAITVDATTELAAINAYRAHFNLNKIEYPDRYFTVTPVYQQDIFGHKEAPRTLPPQPEHEKETPYDPLGKRVTQYRVVDNDNPDQGYNYDRYQV